MRYTKWLMIAAGALVAVGLIGGVAAFAFSQPAGAQGASLTADDHLTRQGPPRSGVDREKNSSNTFLAQALGITEEALQTAQENACKAAVQNALDKGLITQAQAAQLLQNEKGFGRGLDIFLGPDNGIDMDALFAEALGITVDELHTARVKASELEIAQRVSDGQITQDQADMMQAEKAIQEYVNPEALLATSLGISADELQAYRDNNKTMSEILTELGKTPIEVLKAQVDALVTAVQQAVDDGVITQAQADAYLTGRIDGMGFGMKGGPRGGPGGGMPDGMGLGVPGGFDHPGFGTEGNPPANNAPDGISS